MALGSNKKLRRRRGFLQCILQKPCFVISSCFVLPFIVLLQNKHTKLAENGENLIASNKRPLSRSKNLISAQGR